MVLRMLAQLQKQCWVLFSGENFGFHEIDAGTFLSRIVTGDEMWICHWDPETKWKNRQWKHVVHTLPRCF
jgi:hypothetical protein